MWRCAPISLLGLFLAPSIPALADNPHSINSVYVREISKQECLRLASSALSDTKLQVFGTTADAVWANTSKATQMASLYCVPSRKSDTIEVIIVTVSGPGRDSNHRLVDQLVSRLRTIAPRD